MDRGNDIIENRQFEITNKNVAKGIPKSVQQNYTHEDYVKCLGLDNSIEKPKPTFTMEKIVKIQRKFHEIYTIEQTRLGLNSINDKRWIDENGEIPCQKR